MPSPSLDGLQRAAAFAAARLRGDIAGAESLLSSYGDDTERARAFADLSLLTLRLLADHEGSSVDEVATTLALAIAQADLQ